MDENSNELKDVFGLVSDRVAKMVDGVRTHVNFVRERKIVVDLVPLHGSEVEVEALQVEDEIIRDIFETCPVPAVSGTVKSERGGIYKPLDSVDVTIAGRALVLVVCLL